MPYSLKKRLILIASLVLILGFSITALVINSAYQQGLTASVKDKLQVHILAMLSLAEVAEKGIILPDNLADPRFNQPSSGLYAVVFDQQGNERWRSASAISLPKVSLTALAGGQSYFQRTTLAQQSFFIAGLGTIWEFNQQDQQYSFYVLEQANSFDQAEQSFKQLLWFALAVITLVILLLQWWLLIWALQPLKRVSKELKAIENSMQAQLSEHYPQELTQLTLSINRLIASEQQQRQRYKDRMADLAHSIKTPLAVLQGIADTKETVTTEQLLLIKQQVERMTQIINYQLQRAVLGNQVLSFNKVELAALVQQIKQALDKVYQQKQVVCQLNVQPDSYFRGDEGDITEILGNLLDNAYKYGAGEVRLTISQTETQLHMSIEDNGAGLSVEQFNQVKQRGTRLDSQEQGQGIGLATVCQLIEQYQGKISVAESSLLGAKFNISLKS